jgi:hypothetical protein
LRRVAGQLFDGADLGVGHGQRAALDVVGFEARGGVGEDEATLLGEAKQRSQGGDGGTARPPTQRVQHGCDVGDGDLAEVTVGRRPALEEGPDGPEEDVDGGVRPGTSAGITIEQHQQPGADAASEAGREFAGAAVDPGTHGQGGVVVQQSEVGEHFSDSRGGGMTGRSRADLGQRDVFASGAAGQHGRHAIDRAHDGCGGPAVGLAELLGVACRRPQRRVV